MITICGLDVAGAATGYGITQDGVLKDWGKFISKVNRPRGERLFEFYNWIESVFYGYEPDVVLIERPYRGRNSNVLANLSKFIAVVELAAYHALELNIESEWFIDSKTVKKTLGLKKPQGKSVQHHYEQNKAGVVKKINGLYGLSFKYDPKKGKNYNDDDIADAIALIYTWQQLGEKE